jgi:transcriptional regulator with XRE-family HTH domain
MNHPQRHVIKDWASYVRRFRERHGLTQKELADLLTSGQETPVRESTVQRWEYGVPIPPPYLKRALRDIARELAQSAIAT